MPRAMWLEYPGTICNLTGRWDRREGICGGTFAPGLGGVGLDHTPRNGPSKLAIAGRLRSERTLAIKWIATRVQIGIAKGAKTVLHDLVQGHQKGLPASATERCAQVEFQSAISPLLWKKESSRWRSLSE